MRDPLLRPDVIVFDMDGVLVDVRESYHRTIVDLVRFFTDRRIRRAEIHQWKNRSGYNNDWKLVHDWVASLGTRVPYARVVREFQRLYLGAHFDGNVARERWLLDRGTLAQLARRSELAVFTGRMRREAIHTLERFHVRRAFRRVVAMEDVRRQKPDPEGLRRILRGRDPARALYVGDHVDDALAAAKAGVPFLGLLPRRTEARRVRAERLRLAGALAVLGDVNEVEWWIDRCAAVSPRPVRRRLRSGCSTSPDRCR